MTPIEKRKRKLANGIFSLFYTWLIAVCCFDGILILGLFISKRWLPLIVLGMLVVVVGMMRGTRTKGTPCCYRVPGVAVTTLLITAIVMFAINIIGDTWDPQWLKPQPFNEKIPFVSALIVYPSACVVSLWYILIGSRAMACANCTVANGSYTERGLIAKLFKQESGLQLKVLFVMSGIILVIDWCYYYLRYININYNTPDVFFFAGVPTALTVLSILFFFNRYNSMWRHYCHNPALDAIHGNSTALRYLVIVGDHIFLDLHNGIVVDTPVKCFIPFTTGVSELKAQETFRELTGKKAPRLVQAYESEETTTLANAFHYLVFFNSVNELAGCTVPGQLYSLARVTKMTKSGLLAPELRSEIERIYTVAMAWKTYTPDGRRIYPIKNYRPSFRFKDIKDYKVDYNDKRWLAVTVNNEDRHFFRLRRLWNRISGVK